MKLLNFLFLVFFVTTSTFMYTHQKIEAMRLSYEIKEREVCLNKLLDRKNQLEYNVAKLKAPTYLELQLAKEDVRMVLPERWQVFEVTGLREDNRRFVLPLFVRNFVGQIFMSAEAEATPATE